MRRPLNLWLLLVVLVCVVSIWAGRGGRLPFGGSEPVAETPAAPGYLAPPEEATVHLLILNGTDRSGLAREVGLLVPRAGCVAENVGNAPDATYRVSYLVNRRLERSRAEDLVRRLGGVALLMEWDDRGTEDAVLVLGEDHERVLKALAQ